MPGETEMTHFVIVLKESLPAREPRVESPGIREKSHVVRDPTVDVDFRAGSESPCMEVAAERDRVLVLDDRDRERDPLTNVSTELTHVVQNPVRE
jgi:hypothetical protein